MNIMMITVSERSREIGIRRAVGTCRRDIVERFLIEATVITTMGGFVGLILGIAAAQVYSAGTGLPLTIRPSAPIAPTTIAIVVGAIFGANPLCTRRCQTRRPRFAPT